MQFEFNVIKCNYVRGFAGFECVCYVVDQQDKKNFGKFSADKPKPESNSSHSTTKPINLKSTTLRLNPSLKKKN